MRIAEAASKSGLSADTIRFYERSGIVPPIARSGDGQRVFTVENVEWLTLLFWLRKTGMTTQTMRRFASLYHDGDTTIPDRKEILLAHAEVLQERRKELDRCEEILAHKLAIYRRFEADRKARKSANSARSGKAR